MPTKMIPAAGFARLWNALLLNRGHHVWGHREHISPIVSGLLFMVNNRATFNSSVTKALAEAVAANDHLGPILRHLSASSALWPPALRALAKQNRSFPKADVCFGISGAIPRIPEETQKSIDYTYNSTPGALTLVLEAAFYAMRRQGALPLSQSVTAMASWLQHSIDEVVSPPILMEGFPSGFEPENEDTAGTATAVSLAADLQVPGPVLAAASSRPAAPAVAAIP